MTSPGRRSSAVWAIWSMLALGVPAGMGGASTTPDRCSISSWNIRGSPVRHSSSMKTVQTRLLHLCIQDQACVDISASLEGDAGRERVGARRAYEQITGRGGAPVVPVEQVLDVEAEGDGGAADLGFVAGAGVDAGPAWHRQAVVGVGIGPVGVDDAAQHRQARD